MNDSIVMILSTNPKDSYAALNIAVGYFAEQAKTDFARGKAIMYSAADILNLLICLSDVGKT